MPHHAQLINQFLEEVQIARLGETGIKITRPIENGFSDLMKNRSICSVLLLLFLAEKELTPVLGSFATSDV